MNHTPLITPARRGYSARNRRRHSRLKAIAGLALFLALFWSIVAALLFSIYSNL